MLTSVSLPAVCRTGEKVQEQRAADAEAAHGAGRAEGKRHGGAGQDPDTGAGVQQL